MPHPGDLTTADMRALWTHMRQHSGWWTLDMLAPYWRPTFVPHEIQQAMDALEAHGFVESRDQANKLSYSVTPHCKVPSELKLPAPWDPSQPHFITLTTKEPYAPLHHGLQTMHSLTYPRR
jgi:hypothetical protein